MIDYNASRCSVHYQGRRHMNGVGERAHSYLSSLSSTFLCVTHEVCPRHPLPLYQGKFLFLYVHLIPLCHLKHKALLEKSKRDGTRIKRVRLLRSEIHSNRRNHLQVHRLTSLISLSSFFLAPFPPPHSNPSSLSRICTNTLRPPLTDQLA